MARLSDILGQEAQERFAQRVLERGQIVGMRSEVAALYAHHPLMGYSVGELIGLATNLRTSVNWLLTGRHS